MPIDFKFKTFFVPGSIFRFHQLFQKMQSRSALELKEFQEERLRQIVRYAYAYVPYYTQLFDRLGIRPADILTTEDLRRLPILTKDIVRNPQSSLTSTGVASRRAFSISTSGTSGRPVTLLLDRATNGMEFSYYWRYWNWAGYHLGDRFAVFSGPFFLHHPKRAGRAFARQWGTGCIIVNSLFLSNGRVADVASVLQETNCRFLKGLPSVLNEFARFFEKRPPTFRLKAIFTCGEVLLPAVRTRLETTFGCPVRDSYGHMERAVAASECEHGRLHVNSDYGLMELIPEAGPPSSSGLVRARVIATGLHNLSMPLIRYDVGDTVEMAVAQPPCPCGRAFPVITRVEGRSNDVVRTPDGKVITQLFHVLGQVPGVRWGQFVQERIDELRALILPEPGANRIQLEKELRDFVRHFVGESLRFDVVFVSEEESLGKAEKYRAVISRLS